eukprot:scaffold23850_cov17-Tisochrysis_lutea.AAC.1
MPKSQTRANHAVLHFITLANEHSGEAAQLQHQHCWQQAPCFGFSMQETAKMNDAGRSEGMRVQRWPGKHAYL